VAINSTGAAGAGLTGGGEAGIGRGQTTNRGRGWAGTGWRDNCLWFDWKALLTS